MKIALISLTENGRRQTEKIALSADGKLSFTRFSFEKYSDKNSVSFKSLKSLVGDIFNDYEALIFVSSCGIAVRMIAPHIKSKITDPAVLSVDEQGKFVVSLLSGHIGGANSLTKKIAFTIGAEPVITTATDIGGKFSPDSFARANGLHILDMSIAKEIAARLVNGEKIGFRSEYKYVNKPDRFFDDKCTEIGIYIGDDINKNPFAKTLHLVPKNVVIGVGCKKNTDVSIFSEFILQKLDEFKIPLFRISEIHSIDIKTGENAISEFGRRYKIPLKFHSADELMSIDGSFSSSDFVRKTTGADNVCERSAACGGTIFVKKQAGNGVTFAAAKRDIIIDFERDIL